MRRTLVLQQLLLIESNSMRSAYFPFAFSNRSAVAGERSTNHNVAKGEAAQK
jgi:hypothetical protein